ncbi:unnamed protein product [Trifolium pratense]|uniref:Uncharacterized protein n=1 Tax=Trifolium pratense TaxID=57577 RepID=A0ACB0JRK9_TRIPR|nr:unnamed protein product [Trifolium pratense]
MCTRQLCGIEDVCAMSAFFLPLGKIWFFHYVTVIRHRHSTYSKEKLDEVQEEWATHMVEDVINDAKRLQKNS